MLNYYSHRSWAIEQKVSVISIWFSHILFIIVSGTYIFEYIDIYEESSQFS